MVISEFSNYSPLSTATNRSAVVPARQAVTFDAKVNPDAPHEYSVHVAADVEAVEEQPENVAERKARQNQDSVSQAFYGVADFKAIKHKVDVFI